MHPKVYLKKEACEFQLLLKHQSQRLASWKNDTPLIVEAEWQGKAIRFKEEHKSVNQRMRERAAQLS